VTFPPSTTQPGERQTSDDTGDLMFLSLLVFANVPSESPVRGAMVFVLNVELLRALEGNL
jgi:hypothetical protein